METDEFTLEEMKREYATLKNSLEKQEIVSDRLLRETMKTKMKSIRANAMVSVVCGILVIIASPAVFHYNPTINASWWFVAGTILLMGLCIFLDWDYNRKIDINGITSCNLLTFSRQIRKYRSDYYNWRKCGIALGTGWAVWLCVEVWLNSNEHKMAIAMVCGIMAGLVIGMIIGLKLNRNIVDACDEIIDQIENND